MFESLNADSAQSRLITMKVQLWIPLVLLVLLAATLVAQPLLVPKAERGRDAAVQQVADQASAARLADRKRAQDLLSRVSDKNHMLFGTALSWALRSALARSNRHELDQFVVELIKNDSIRLVVVADEKGRIVAASDLDLKGAQLAKRFPDAGLGGSSISIERMDASRRRLVIPVFGVTARRGTAMVVYEEPTE